MPHSMVMFESVARDVRTTWRFAMVVNLLAAERKSIVNLYVHDSTV